jgi:hypothetical protein
MLKPHRRLVLLFAACILTAVAFPRAARLAAVVVNGEEALAADYAKDIRPTLERFCWRCHGAKKQEADMNLEAQATLADVRKSPATWQKVLEMLDSQQMPPMDARQPSDAERTRLRKWVVGYLKHEARAHAGDPGPVVLRRLSNAEYTYTLRDLTGLAGLQPARQFPVDSAAGEGFTNTGQALVMSPALLEKYLDAAKEVAAHAVLLPDGIRFSPSSSRRDWTNEILDRIRALYRQHSVAQGSSRVNLQGIVFDTNDGGRLPLESYLEATLAEREALRGGSKSIKEVAHARGLSPKYLGSLWQMLNGNEPSPLFDLLRTRWRTAAPRDATTLASEIARWQTALTKFQSVGHMKSWMVPSNPTTTRQELRLKLLPAAGAKEITLHLVAGDCGDGAEHDRIALEKPRFVIAGRADVQMQDVRSFVEQLLAVRKRHFEATAKCLHAAAAVRESFDLNKLAREHGVEADSLAAWLDCVGVGTAATPKLDFFTQQMQRAGNYDFVKGWGSPETPLLVANSSDRHVRIPGNMKPHGVCVHPSPTLHAAVGWRSPVAGSVRVEGAVTHAHPECGNGVAWALELRRGATRRRLAAGNAQGGKPVAFGPLEKVAIRQGDLLILLIGPRDGNHACDLTDLEFTIKSANAGWSLTGDVSPDVLAGNPHADRLGNKDVWHFFTEPVASSSAGPVIPAGSVLARWLDSDKTEERAGLAAELQRLLTDGPPADEKHADAQLYRQLASVGGPLLARVGPQGVATAASAPAVGLTAPGVTEVRLPADLFMNAEFVATAVMEAAVGQGSVQLQALLNKPDAAKGLRPDLPILIGDSQQSRQRWERAFSEFRSLFPAALCYTKIVPVDEVVTLTLYHREDEPLCRLMLDEQEHARLNRLWQELHFVGHDALTLVDAFNQLMEYATQDADPRVFEPFRKPIHERAAAFRKELVAAEAKHVEAVVELAGRAYRRPLRDEESLQLRELYRQLRVQELPHESAIRMLVARVLAAPAFLYRLEQPAQGKAPSLVSDFELANRLSYFLWSSLPDAELLAAASNGSLHQPEVLTAQARRMLKDPRVRRLAIEFGCQWLHIHGFDTLDEKSARHFPSFADLRDDMYEEAIRFMTDAIQNDAPVLTLFDADHTFLNDALAKHYGIPGVSGPEWRRVEGVRQFGRGGVLGLAATLAKQAGASRTSPILRGNWVSEVLLGEKLPRPPKDVPQLPEDEANTQLSVRQLVEKHSSDPRCAVCHARIDPFGFALEGYDAIGRRRTKDLGERLIDTSTRLKDNTELNGMDGLRRYLTTHRRDDVLRQFYRKLLGYALGRAVQLSDEPFLDELLSLPPAEQRFSAVVSRIILSDQFRKIRGAEFSRGS